MTTIATRLAEIRLLVCDVDGVLTDGRLHYDERGAAGHVVALILDELHHEQSLPLHLPMPRDRRLRRLCTTLLERPGDPRTLEEWAQSASASPRTLARLFVAETGLTFGAFFTGLLTIVIAAWIPAERASRVPLGGMLRVR